jgi:hypothetical protein
LVGRVRRSALRMLLSSQQNWPQTRIVHRMPKSDTAPYGSWRSPITSDLILAQITMLSDVRVDGEEIYWLEGRPQDQGRNVIVRVGPDGIGADITSVDFNVRTRVHEYGGGAWSLTGGTCIFSNFEDQRLYRQRTDRTDPEPLTPEPVNPRPAAAEPRTLRERFATLLLPYAAA